MKSHPILLAAAASALISLPAQAAVLASYNFSTSVAPTTTAANLTAGSFTFATGFTTNTGYSGTGQNIFARVTATTGSTLAGAITANQYVKVTIDADAGFALNLTSLTVDLGYSLDGVAVPTGIGVNLGASVFSSVGGFTAPAVLATQTFTAANQGATGILYQNVNIDLTAPAYQGLSSPIEFRIYFYDSVTGSSPTQPIHRVDNFTLNGAVIPEPSAALLGGLGLLALLRRRRN